MPEESALLRFIPSRLLAHTEFFVQDAGRKAKIQSCVVRLAV